MYRSDKFVRLSKGCDLLQMSLSLHGICVGSIECYDNKIVEDLVYCLNEALKKWEKPVHSPEFDNAVKSLIEISLKEHSVKWKLL